VVTADHGHPQSGNLHLFSLRPRCFEAHRVYRRQYVYSTGRDADLEDCSEGLEISLFYLV
jgi:hypothetical protein